MRRRRLLTLCGSLVAGTGCLGQSERTPAPGTPSETGTAIETPTATLVEDAVVQPGVVGPDSPDSIGVYDSAGQYLVLTLGAGGPERSAFAFQFDGATYTPATFDRGLYRDGEWNVQYGEDGGPLVFALPESGDAGDARLTWPDGEWAPSELVRDRLEAPLPPMAVSLTGPATAAEGDGSTLSVSVTNEGTVTGRYALALSRSGPMLASTPEARITGELDGGASATHEFDIVAPTGEETTTYYLDAPGESDDSHTVSPTQETEA